MINVLLDTSPLDSGHALRGIGMYTRQLAAFLESSRTVQMVRSATKEADSFDPDIVHYPFFDLFFDTLPLVRKNKTVVTIHDVIPLKFSKYFPAGIKGTARLVKQKTALKSVQAVITDSQASKTDIEEHLGVSPDKIHVIPLAANPNLVAADEATIRRTTRKYKLPKNYVLYVGDINYNKNIPQLIKAIRYLPREVKLVCVGKNFAPQEIPEWEWIETQLALSDVEEKVKFISDIPSDGDEELSAIYSGAVCYVQPSLYEGFGLPVLEAMRCHTPVVSSNTSSLPEVAGDQAILVEPEAEQLAKGIEQVLSWSATHRKQVIRDAAAWADTFTWKKVAQQTTSVYKQLVSS